MITVSHLFKDFDTPDGSRTHAVKDISLHVSRGEVVGMIGPSGSGKSVLLRCMAGLEQPTSGEVSLTPGVKIGMVFQQFNLFGHLSVLDNVTLAPMKLLGLGREEADELAMEMLRHVGMAEHARQMPSSLSGGQQQRAAIARTLAMKPEILLMDEPTSSLDPTMVDEVQGVVRSLAQEGMTMVFVTHEMRFARDTSSRILFVHNGCLLEDGTPSQIFNEPRLPQTRSFVNRIRLLAFDIASRDFDLYDMTSKIKQFCIRCSIAEKMDSVTHVVEEMLVLIADFTTPVHIEVNHSDLKQETSVVVLQREVEVSALEKPDTDELAVILIHNASQNISTEHTSEGVKTIFEI